MARRADVSVEWYTRLEQGRGGKPSAQVLHSVAEALLLTPVEREHLFLLAHGHNEASVSHDSGRTAGARFRRVLNAFPYSPAYIKTAAWNIEAWNDAARLVLTNYEALPPSERNVLKILFLHVGARSVLLDWEREARLAVSTFRLELARWGATVEASALVEDLSRKSADFAAMWSTHDVGTLGEGVKHLYHPVAGDLAMRYSSYAIDDAPGLGLVLYTPETDSDTRRIRCLLIDR